MLKTLNKEPTLLKKKKKQTNLINLNSSLEMLSIKPYKFPRKPTSQVQRQQKT